LEKRKLNEKRGGRQSKMMEGEKNKREECGKNVKIRIKLQEGTRRKRRRKKKNMK
jgi:hypothetical protein